MHTCGCYRLQVGHTCTSRAEGRFVADGKRGGDGGLCLYTCCRISLHVPFDIDFNPN